MDRADRRRQAKRDVEITVRGVDPKDRHPDQTAAIARLSYELLETAKQTGDIDPLLAFLHAKVNATIGDLADIPIACGKGCSHCCHGSWSSVTAPELIYVAKVVRRRGESAISRVIEAEKLTEALVFGGPRWVACPMLVDDACSIYEHRPMVCRLVTSSDASICARSCRNITNETIPVPPLYVSGRMYYAFALACALKHADRSTVHYEFNAGLKRALERSDCEAAWLAGEDVFAGVRQDPGDIFGNPMATQLFDIAFPAAT